MARLSGAPVLMMFACRSEDYRHQVVEISPPLSMEGEPEAAFRRCVAAMEAAIRTNPALWHFWNATDVLTNIGLIPAESSSAENVAVALRANRTLHGFSWPPLPQLRRSHAWGRGRARPARPRGTFPRRLRWPGYSPPRAT
jgi:hypothetical protein